MAGGTKARAPVRVSWGQLLKRRRRIRLRARIAWTAAVVLGACSTTEGPTPVLIPNRTLNLSHSVSIPADTIALAAAMFVVIDPLAPNWRIEQYDLGDDRYAIALKKKRFTMGGDGESQQIFRRRIERILREQGFVSYQILEFSEGIESNVPIAQRVSRGLVQFARGTP
jgi:hypothetical protein